MKTIHLYDEIGSLVMTRNAVIGLFDSFADGSSLVFDFEGVEFISRSAAHEYLRQKLARDLLVKEIHMSRNVKAMFVLVAKQVGKIFA